MVTVAESGARTKGRGVFSAEQRHLRAIAAPTLALKSPTLALKSPTLALKRKTQHGQADPEQPHWHPMTVRAP
jgi:hypothetical protein